jgi:uncharacterized protein YndB with AHSA1/START domain
MSEIRIVRDYPYPVARVWRALTDPDLVPLWTATGAGGRPEGFAPVPGAKFRFVAKPKPGWNGIVNCEVLEAREPVLLRYTWTDGGGGDTTEVTYRLESVGDGTRFTYEHTGFTGIGGLFMAQLLCARLARPLRPVCPAGRRGRARSCANSAAYLLRNSHVNRNPLDPPFPTPRGRGAAFPSPSRSPRATEASGAARARRAK